MRLRKLRPQYFVLGGLVVVGCGLAVSDICGQGPLHDRAPPPCVLNGPCLPNRGTWGYYAPKWRRWPGTVAEAEVTPSEATGLEGTQPPPPESEDVRVPLPSSTSTGAGTGAGPATEPGIAPPTIEPNPVAPVPSPAGPPGGGAVPGGGVAPGGFPAAPIPNVPIPGGQLPEIAPPLENGPVTPPGGLQPSAPNPFNGSRNSGGGGLRIDEDPPPALPASLRSSQRMRDARRAAEAGSPPSLARGLTRLPNPAATPQSRRRYDIQQASATVWASGTDDILPADPNAGRVQQAIHHEPVE